jgi:hypothetical protein
MKRKSNGFLVESLFITRTGHVLLSEIWPVFFSAFVIIFIRQNTGQPNRTCGTGLQS